MARSRREKGVRSAASKGPRQDAAAADGLAASLGRAMRGVRKRAGLTLAEVASRGGVTQAFLSQVENGRSMPSLLTLHRVADALGVSAHALLAGSGAEAVSLVRRDEGRQFERTEVRGAVLERFLTRGRHQMEPGEVWAAPGAESGEHVDHAGEEFVYVLGGRIAVELKGAAVEELGPGDCLYYPASIPHRWVVQSEKPARFLVVASPASF